MNARRPRTAVIGVWPGHRWFDKAVDHQVAFVIRSLARKPDTVQPHRLV